MTVPHGHDVLTVGSGKGDKMRWDEIRNELDILAGGAFALVALAYLVWTILIPLLF